MMTPRTAISARPLARHLGPARQPRTNLTPAQVAEIENQASRNRTGWRSPHPTPAGDQAPRRTLTDENRAVLDLMRRGERLTVEQIVIRAGMTRPAARGQLKKLVGMGLVSMARVNGQLWTYEKIGRG